MTGQWFDIGMALWLGILTSISPCPLATNIAAISYVGRRVGNAKMVLLSGLLYTIGRTVAYVLVGILVVKGLLSIPGVSNFLQHYMSRITGPVCIVVGLLLLDIVKFSFGGGGVSERLQKRVDAMGIWGAGLLGLLFALAFCPTSAGLFFGGLVPIAVRTGSTVTMPALYGIGTALPVIVFAVVIAFATQAVGRIFNVLTVVDKWARKITAVLFLLVGLYLILTQWFGLYLGF
jgi:cytochrome c-type biogenesis protein